jgi:hypothetical protein
VKILITTPRYKGYTTNQTSEEIPITGLRNAISELNYDECLNVKIHRVDEYGNIIEIAYFQPYKHVVEDYLKENPKSDTMYVSPWKTEKGRATSMQNIPRNLRSKWSRYITYHDKTEFNPNKRDMSINLELLFTDKKQTKADKIRATKYEKLTLDT